MSEQLHEWCLELLTNATGDRIPHGHTTHEAKFHWYGFASAGYRNTDVVNSMIAFFYEHPEITTLDKPWWASGINKEAVNKYMEWAKKHMDEEDFYAVEMKARDVIPYIRRYRKDPVAYLIECSYLDINRLRTFCE